MSREAAPPSDLQAPAVSERTRKPAPLGFTCERSRESSVSQCHSWHRYADGSPEPTRGEARGTARRTLWDYSEGV